MMNSFIRKAILVFVLFCTTVITWGQGSPVPNPIATTNKPYKVLTSGRQITIQSKQSLKSLLVWSASGHRIVEEKQLPSNNYSFTVPAKEKFFYMVIETAEGKRFTEKMGVK